MEISAVGILTTQVLWAGFMLPVAFGAIAQRSHFCTMGAGSDIVIMEDWTCMRMWAMAIGVAMIGFAGLVLSGLVDSLETRYAPSRVIWLFALAGGAMFGFGMVLSLGCGNKTLVRIGGGSLKSLVVFIVMGVAALTTLKGITAVIRVATVNRVGVDFSGNATLPNWLAGFLGVMPSLAGTDLACGHRPAFDRLGVAGSGSF